MLLHPWSLRKSSRLRTSGTSYQLRGHLQWRGHIRSVIQTRPQKKRQVSWKGHSRQEGKKKNQGREEESRNPTRRNRCKFFMFSYGSFAQIHAGVIRTGQHQIPDCSLEEIYIWCLGSSDSFRIESGVWRPLFHPIFFSSHLFDCSSGFS